MVCVEVTVSADRSMPPTAARENPHQPCRGRRPRRPVRMVCVEVTVGASCSMPPAAAWAVEGASPYGENG
ncbi:MAG: hypothetical protein IJX47_08255 [Clostridia bacterium]|nr:hypothetical protein [Clostridia bacterium]